MPNPHMKPGYPVSALHRSEGYAFGTVAPTIAAEWPDFR